MEVGITDSCGVELEKNLIRAGFWDGHGFDGDGEVRAAGGADACAAGLGDFGSGHCCGGGGLSCGCGSFGLSKWVKGREKLCDRRAIYE